ncbi:MAG: hypothetical protein AB7I09_18185 [Planctomycetota bacterium]
MRTRLAVFAFMGALALSPGLAIAQDKGTEDRAKWADHMGDIPFLLTYAKGLAESKLTGRPMMVFFTATW